MFRKENTERMVVAYVGESLQLRIKAEAAQRNMALYKLVDEWLSEAVDRAERARAAGLVINPFLPQPTDTHI